MGPSPLISRVAPSCSVSVYAILEKMYGTPEEGERRYTPPVCLSAESTVIRGSPDREHIKYELC